MSLGGQYIRSGEQYMTLTRQLYMSSGGQYMRSGEKYMTLSR
jgi:hypothetical protein